MAGSARENLVGRESRYQAGRETERQDEMTI